MVFSFIPIIIVQIFYVICIYRLLQLQIGHVLYWMADSVAEWGEYSSPLKL